MDLGGTVFDAPKPIVEPAPVTEEEKEEITPTAEASLETKPAEKKDDDEDFFVPL